MPPNWAQQAEDALNALGDTPTAAEVRVVTDRFEDTDLMAAILSIAKAGGGGGGGSLPAADEPGQILYADADDAPAWSSVIKVLPDDGEVQLDGLNANFNFYSTTLFITFDGSGKLQSKTADDETFLDLRRASLNIGATTGVPESINVGGSVGAAILDADGNFGIQVQGSGMGFFGAAPTARPTGVAVTAAGIHAALVTLGLITA